MHMYVASFKSRPRVALYTLWSPRSTYENTTPMHWEYLMTSRRIKLQKRKQCDLAATTQSARLSVLCGNPIFRIGIVTRTKKKAQRAACKKRRLKRTNPDKCEMRFLVEVRKSPILD